MKKKRSAAGFPGFEINSSLPGVPLEAGEMIQVANETEHALFLQCSEVFRVIDLLARNLQNMVDTYSKYRTRDPFRDSLILRFFGGDEAVLSRIDPSIEVLLLGAFNRLHELRLTLSHADALPFTVKSAIENELVQLRKNWDSIREAVRARHGWNLKALSVVD